MSNVTFQIKESETLPTVAAICEGQEIGYFQVASEGFGDFRIEDTKIDVEFRGQGIYRKMIVAAFELLQMSTLRSDNRNQNSNPIYEKGCGQELEFDTPVWITCANGQLTFSL